MEDGEKAAPGRPELPLRPPELSILCFRKVSGLSATLRGCADSQGFVASEFGIVLPSCGIV